METRRARTMRDIASRPVGDTVGAACLVAVRSVMSGTERILRILPVMETIGFFALCFALCK